MDKKKSPEVPNLDWDDDLAAEAHAIAARVPQRSLDAFASETRAENVAVRPRKTVKIPIQKCVNAM